MYRSDSCPYKKVQVVRKKGKGIAGGLAFRKYLLDPIDESVFVRIIVKDGPPGDAPHHQMMDCTCHIDAGLPRHEE